MVKFTILCDETVNCCWNYKIVKLLVKSLLFLAQLIFNVLQFL